MQPKIKLIAQRSGLQGLDSSQKCRNKVLTHQFLSNHVDDSVRKLDAQGWKGQYYRKSAATPSMRTLPGTNTRPTSQNSYRLVKTTLKSTDPEPDSTSTEDLE